MRSALLILPLLLQGCMAYADDPVKPGRYAHQLTVSGVERDYRLTVPPGYDGQKGLPLVIGLHGWTGSSELFEMQTGFPVLAEKEGFLFAAPNGLGKPQGWNVGWIDLSGKAQDEVAFLSAIVDDVEKRAKVDPDRIFICGHSNGGFLTWLAASKLSNRLAGIGVVAGAMGIQLSDGTRRVIPEPAGKLPSALFIHGEADPVVAYKNGDKATLNRVVSQQDAVKWYAEKVSGLSASPVSEGEKTSIWEWKGPGREVRFVSVKGGNHDWFGGMTRNGPEAVSGVNSTEEIWNFFKRQKRS